jgi:hypothetical protein
MTRALGTPQSHFSDVAMKVSAVADREWCDADPLGDIHTDDAAHAVTVLDSPGAPQRCDAVEVTHVSSATPTSSCRRGTKSSSRT